MDGILIIDKPVGLTSHDVVYRVRRALGIKRVGHTGTLDPFATGVMVVLVGRATRLAQFLDKDEKEYEARMKFGYETDSGDVTGQAKPGGQPHIPAMDDIERVLVDFMGESEQVPPMYSAKKVDGKKLYELARKGEVVERKPVNIKITKLELVSASGDTATVRVACSAGTYVRTLAEDIARAAGSAAHLTELRRIRAGNYTLDQSITLDALAADTVPSDHLRPMDEAVGHLPAVELSPERAKRTANGLSTRIDLEAAADGSSIAMYDDAGSLIAIGRYAAGEKVVQPKVVLL